MPLRDHMQLISTDDHLVEHAKLWTDRLPHRHKLSGPRVEELKDATVLHGVEIPRGSQVWLYEDRIYPHLALNAVAGRQGIERGLEPLRYEEIRRGCYDPLARLADMDEDGVQAHLCFPTFPRFAGTTFLEGRDRELAGACVRAWNDFVMDEWCAAAPDRYIPLVILPLWDAEKAAAEIEMFAGRGARAVSFPENPAPLGLPSFHSHAWDPVFRAAEECAVPLCLHFGTSRKLPQTAPDAPFAVQVSLMGSNSMSAAADLLFSPVFTKFPGLKIALSEGGIGWMPYLLQRAEAVWERHRLLYQGMSDESPSRLFADHIWGCFIDDPSGVRERHAIGIGQIMWESDYPHADSEWPNSRSNLERVMHGIPDDEVQAIVELNARSLFNFGLVRQPQDHCQTEASQEVS